MSIRPKREGTTPFACVKLNISGFNTLNVYAEGMFDNMMYLEEITVGDEISFGEIDPGATGDLKRAYDIVMRFVDDYCSNGFDRWVDRRGSSDATYERRDMQVSVELENFYRKAKKILIDNREFLDKVATALMNKDILTSAEIETLKKP